MQTSLVEVLGHKYQVGIRKHWFSWFRPNFVWFHGFCAPFQDQQHILDEIYNRGYNVYALNLPGHGDSEMVPEVNWDSLVQVATELIVNIWKLRHFSVGGYSMGAGLALKVTAALPERVRSVKLVAPFCHPSSIAHLSTLPGAIRFRLHNSHHARAGIRPRMAEPLAANFTWNLETYARPVLSYSLDLANNKAPIVALLHVDDEVIDNECVAEVISSIPCGVTVQIPHLGHDIFYIDDFETRMLVDRLGF
jgi:alpha-beta hydrolase superfamily lysophospholipase